MMLTWTALYQNFEMNRPARAQTTIHLPLRHPKPPSTFFIEAAVEFAARDASICALDAGV
jgi:hypothetical protein